MSDKLTPGQLRDLAFLSANPYQARKFDDEAARREAEHNDGKTRDAGGGIIRNAIKRIDAQARYIEEVDGKLAVANDKKHEALDAWVAVRRERDALKARVAELEPLLKHAQDQAIERGDKLFHAVNRVARLEDHARAIANDPHHTDEVRRNARAALAGDKTNG